MSLLPFSSAPYKQTSDTIHLKKAGDQMSGTLNMGRNPIIIKDTNADRWALSANTDGSLNTSKLVHGSPIGLLLCLTYP